MTTTNHPAPVLEPDVLYLGDGGRCYCGAHSGASATYTGRDLSGQAVVPLDRATCVALGETPDLLRCEHCGRGIA
jgi:hypothetical protein